MSTTELRRTTQHTPPITASTRSPTRRRRGVGMIVAGTLLSLSLAALLACDPALLVLAGSIGVLAALQAIGLLMILCDNHVWGARVVMCGAIPMMPVGLVSAFGARAVLDDVALASY